MLSFFLSVNLGISSLATMEAVNIVLLQPRLPTSIPFLHSLFFHFSQYSFTTIFGQMNVLCPHVLFPGKYCSQVSQVVYHYIPFLVQSYFPLELLIAFFFFLLPLILPRLHKRTVNSFQRSQVIC